MLLMDTTSFEPNVSENFHGFEGACAGGCFLYSQEADSTKNPGVLIA